MFRIFSKLTCEGNTIFSAVKKISVSVGNLHKNERRKILVLDLKLCYKLLQHETECKLFKRRVIPDDDQNMKYC